MIQPTLLKMENMNATIKGVDDTEIVRNKKKTVIYFLYYNCAKKSLNKYATNTLRNTRK